MVVNRRASRTAGPDPSNARCSMVREPTFSLTASYPSPPSRASAGLVGNEPAMNLYHSGSRTESREDDLGAMSVTVSIPWTCDLCLMSVIKEHPGADFIRTHALVSFMFGCV